MDKRPENRIPSGSRSWSRALFAVLAVAVFAFTSTGAVLALAGARGGSSAPSAPSVTAKEARIAYVGPKKQLALDVSPSADELVVYVLDEKGKQVEGCAFQAVVTAEDGGSMLGADINKDGVIILENPEPGDYTVSLLRYGGFASPEALPVHIDEHVAHVKVDVHDRVRNQGDVDMANDDSQYEKGNRGGSSSGSSDDTVEYVDSGKEAVGRETVQKPVTDAYGNQLYGSVPRMSQLYESGARYLYNADGSESWVRATVDANGYLVKASKKNEYGEYVECTYSVIDQYGYPVCDADGDPVYIFDRIVALTTSEEETVYRYTGWQTINGKVYYFDKNGNKVTGLQVIGGLTYYFDADGVRSSCMGIDVSTWNEDIDWDRVRNGGIDFVIVRAGFRGYGTGSLVEDSLFWSHMNGAREAGLKVGAYFFTQAITETEAVEEASMCLDMCEPFILDMPIFIDMEDPGSYDARTNRLSNGQRTAIVQAFCDTIRAGGYTAGLYASKYWLEDMINVSQLSQDTVIWLAHYTYDQTDYHGRYDLWQYTCEGDIPGVPGDVDLNIGYIGF